MGSQEFPVILPENDGGNGGGGGVEVPLVRMRVERSVWEKKKKKNRKQGREWAGHREDKMEWLCGG